MMPVETMPPQHLLRAEGWLQFCPCLPGRALQRFGEGVPRVGLTGCQTAHGTWGLEAGAADPGRAFQWQEKHSCPSAPT